MIDAIAPIANPVPSVAAVEPTAHVDAFALALADASADRDPVAAEAAVRDAAAKLVSSALLLPVLGSMRESNFLAGPFKAGMAERRFGPMLDAQVADRVTSSANFPLIDAIVERFRPQIDAGSSLGREGLHG